MGLGPYGFDVIEGAPDTVSFTTLAQLALTVILFNQAAKLDLQSILRRGHVTFRLLVVGIPLSLLQGTGTALLLLPVMPVWEAVCRSAIVAAFAGGLAFAVAARRSAVTQPTQFSEATGHLLELVVFAMFGGHAVISGWRDAGWRVILFGVVALIVVRLIAVGFALLRSDLPARDRLFIGWFGPRGIGTLVLGLLVIDPGQISQADVVTQAVVVVVTLSLVLHSLTTPLGIRWISRDRLAPSHP